MIILAVNQEFEDVFLIINLPVQEVGQSGTAGGETYSQGLHKFWGIKITQKCTVPIKRCQ